MSITKKSQVCETQHLFYNLRFVKHNICFNLFIVLSIHFIVLSFFDLRNKTMSTLLNIGEQKLSKVMVTQAIINNFGKTCLKDFKYNAL